MVGSFLTKAVYAVLTKQGLRGFSLNEWANPRKKLFNCFTKNKKSYFRQAFQKEIYLNKSIKVIKKKKSATSVSVRDPIRQVISNID